MDTVTANPATSELGNRILKVDHAGEQGGRRAEKIAADRAQHIASGPREPALHQRGAKDRPVAFLVKQEIGEPLAHRGRRQRGDRPLRPIDANRALLAGMVDLEDAVAEFAWVLARDDLIHRRAIAAREQRSNPRTSLGRWEAASL